MGCRRVGYRIVIMSRAKKVRSDGMAATLARRMSLISPHSEKRVVSSSRIWSTRGRPLTKEVFTSDSPYTSEVDVCGVERRVKELSTEWDRIESSRAE